MSFITYAQFVENVRSNVFPDGEAENLRTTHENYIKEALIDLQTFVPSLRDNNVNFYGKEDFQEWCNTNFANIERGVVHAVYAFKVSTGCKRFHYHPKSTAFISCWIDSQKCVVCDTDGCNTLGEAQAACVETTVVDDDDDEEEPAEEVLVDSSGDVFVDSQGNPFTTGESSSSGSSSGSSNNSTSGGGTIVTEVVESDCSFKLSNRYYAIGPNSRLFLAPRFPCGYRIAVHWEGVKRNYSGTDPLPDDVDLLTTVSKYLQAQRALYLDRDTAIYDRIMHPKNGEYSIARANMIHRCTNERRVRLRQECLGGFDVLQPFFFDPLATNPNLDPSVAVDSEGNVFVDSSGNAFTV